MAPLSTAARRAALLRATPAAVARRAFTDASPLLPAAKPIQTVPSATAQIAPTKARRAFTDAAPLLPAPKPIKTATAQITATKTSSVGPRALSCLPHSATRTRGFSSNLLGNRSFLSAPTHLITKRGIASKSEAFTPELKHQLQRMVDASEARHQEVLKKVTDFKAKVNKEYAVIEVEMADNILPNARVGWRVVSASLAAAVLGICLVLNIKRIWFEDLKNYSRTRLDELLAKLLIDLEKDVKSIVREMSKRD